MNPDSDRIDRQACMSMRRGKPVPLHTCLLMRMLQFAIPRCSGPWIRRVDYEPGFRSDRQAGLYEHEARKAGPAAYMLVDENVAVRDSTMLWTMDSPGRL